MSIDRLIIVGAGGHALVVMDALQSTYPRQFHFAFVDDDIALHGQMILGQPVLGAASQFVQPGTCFHVAVGSNATRYLIHQRLIAAGGVPTTVIHPKAAVSSHADLAAASFVAAHAVIAPAAKIGIGTIVNHGAVIDHDCAVGNFCHIAPGASLAGRVTLGRQVFVGAGARVLPGVFIGNEAVIGAGAVVRADVSPNTKVVGVPARLL